MDTLSPLLDAWHTAARTSLGLFWMAFWAFGLGYFISSLIQVFVTRARMQRSLGNTTPGTVTLASFFGFLSSSCSFSALATTRALFAKGAGLVPSLAFLLASTNLVVELGIVIAVFLGWQFVVGEYVGGILLILLAWAVVRATAPAGLPGPPAPGPGGPDRGLFHLHRLHGQYSPRRGPVRQRRGLRRRHGLYLQ